MKPNLTKNDILNTLRNDKAFLNAQFGVISIGLFGSYSKEKQNPDSDIDILVELKEPKYEWLAGLQIHLEQKFGKKVDLIRKRKQIKNNIIERIERNVIYA
jgi:predicted nucleotidyltransferase